MLYKVTKRLLDLIFFMIALPFLIILYSIIFILIKLDSPGPVILKQKRIGKDMQIFTMYKFRTMYIDADINGLPPTDEYDKRVTTVGKFLRKSSLDETPQFINLFLGQMSLVGPRPEIQALLPYYQPAELKRFDVIPGLTGLWQISGRKNKQSISQKASIDIEYINQASFWFDLKILIKTPLVVLKARGAY
ncbi:hypothetical protein A3J61_02325 [Candidatus Nomurabacteria bacterium RIFCSPHIGHO2_02_FULL_38_15]|uniref:Bacterial sugar transferase domain-containing protein n=1 Tax=Candidatus Nomurabacteria bacterium RIFCSPHIGHO2_02_FULL_38_15 TaxID=1801752 RepID=A0A1F6VQC1_9BACT|nr:MAG: hypothetical protein A3J61_02325 [Candidatus Nomurabacteria bacterium RIFCSPHIGHO2_02_FULL_38_15]